MTLGNVGESQAGRPGNLGAVVAFRALAFKLAGAAHGGGLLTGAALGRLLVEAAQLHFPENTLALHLLLEHAHGLIDVVIVYDDLQRLIRLFAKMIDGSG